MSLFRYESTPAVRRFHSFIYGYMLVMSWGIFPAALIAVYAASFYMIWNDPHFAAQPLPVGRLMLLVAIFVVLMVMFWAIGRFARRQIARIKAGGAPWPWPRER